MSRWDDFFPNGSRPSTVGTLVFLLYGLLVWFAQFSAIYAAHTLACLSLAGAAVLSDVLALSATAAALLVLMLHLIWPHSVARLLGVPAETVESLRLAAQAMSALAGIAVLWSGAAILLVDACAQAR